MANLRVSVETDYNGRGIRQAQADMQDLSNKTIQQLKDRLKGLQNVLDNVRPNSAQFTRYSQEITKTKAQLEALQKAAKNNGQVLATSMGGATSSVIEFNRVIQDAPFGIQGVGNNIQSLTQNFGYLISQTGSARKATSVFFSTLITPANLAVLAVSAITTAWTIYERQQQKAAKAAKGQVDEQTKYLQGLKDFVDTQDATSRATSNAAKSTAEETTKLKVLYGITQNATFSMQQRNRAADQLQRLYPEYFKNLTNESILTGKAADSYATLARNIVSTGIAQAAVNLSAKNTETLLDINLRRVSLSKEDNDLLTKKNEKQDRYNKLLKASTKGNARDQFSAERTQMTKLEGELGDIEKRRKEIQDQRQEDFKNEVSLLKDQYNLQNLINKKVKEGADIVGKPGTKYDTTKTVNPGTDVIKNALTDSSNGLAIVDDKGLAKQLEKLKQEYTKYYDDIDKSVAANAKKGIDETARANKAKAQLDSDYQKRKSALETQEAERVSNEVQRIRDDSGVASEQTMEKEFKAIEKWYDAEVVKANGNAEILAAIEEGLQQRKLAVVQKYNEKYADAVDKLQKKISDIEERAFAQNTTGLPAQTKKLQAEIDARIKKINEYYDALQKINKDGILGDAVIYGQRAASVAAVTANGKQAQDPTDSLAAKNLNAAVGKFTSDMYDSISNIGKKNAEITDKYNKARAGATDAEIVKLNELERREKEIANSFGSIFSSIFESLTSAMDNLFKATLTNALKTTFNKGLEDINFAGLSNKMSTVMISAAGLLGNAISSIGGGKNSFTSAAGGALSGAASGAVLGSAVPGIGTAAGAVIGGVVGAIGGLFSSSKARQQEELERKQLEEQKKTNEILDRQSRLAYSSSIIGRMTDRGVITAVDVNEFGELTTTISGNDIVVSYDKTKAKQARGK